MAFLPYPKGIGVSCHKFMKNYVIEEWDEYKKELGNSLQDIINSDTPEKETIAIMIEMLKIAKLKEIIQYNNQEEY